MEIWLNSVEKSFNRKKVIQSTTLSMVSGGLTTLLGPSGCGKTTLLRMIAGLETPDDGEIYFDDKCVFSKQKRINLPPEKRRLGFVFQDFALWPHMSVFENVAFGLRAAKQTKELADKVKDALHAVQLDDFADRYPHQLSGGQQQRVAFARAIIIEPQCILFDEPLSALDALLREEMRAELRELITRLKITAVFVTHDQTEAMSMSDAIAVMSAGAVEQYGTPEEIYGAPKTEFVARFVGSSNWIDDTHMFRPEKANLEPSAGDISFEAEVSSAQFLGSTYQLRLNYGNRSWSIPSSYKMSVGTKVTIYIDKNDLIEVKETR
jgi:ABC transporter, ATP-binding protein